MAGEKKVNSNLDVEGSIKVTTVPNSTGTLVTFNSSTKVFGTRTNGQIISDLNLSSNFVPTSRTLTINGTTFDLSANRTWNIPDNDTITRLRGTTSGTYTSGDLTLLAGSNTTITQSGANITIASTNTTYTAGTGLTLTGTVFTPTFGTAAGTVAQGNHTHTFASLTSKPTTIAGYGITDAPTKTGIGATGTWGISITGNAATATSLQTARNLTIGNTGKTFNGTSDVSWSLAEIGAQSILTNPVTGTGTINQIVKFGSSTGVVNSQISDTGTEITLSSSGSPILITQGDRVKSNKPIEFNSAIDVSDDVTGEIVYFGIGSVVAGNLYFLNPYNRWTLVDSDTVSRSIGLLGIARSTGVSSTVGMLVRGHAKFQSNSNYTAMTTIGAPLYISQTSGGFSQTAPIGTGKIVRVIGYVQSIDQDQIYFCPDNTWIQLT